MGNDTRKKYFSPRAEVMTFYQDVIASSGGTSVGTAFPDDWYSVGEGA